MKMPNLLRAIAFALFLLPSSVLAQTGSHERHGQVFHREAKRIVDSAWSRDGPGLAVMVMRGDEMLFSATGGYADIEASTPATLDTVFRIGSMTKQMVAALVLDLVEEGEISLDDPLDRFLHDYPSPGGQATIRELLNHTSGIRSYNETPGWFGEQNIGRRYTTAELIEVIKDEPAVFESGTDWAYNNSGYVLLAAVVEQVTGMPWPEALRERITGPLDLSTVRHDTEGASIPFRATPYTVTAEGVSRAPLFHPTSFSGAGALVASARDLVAWSHALHHGEVLEDATLAQMTSPTVLADGRSFPYGFGFFREQIQGIQAISHGGNSPGGAAMGIYLPIQDIFVVALANNDAPQVHPATIARKLAALAAGRPYPSLDVVQTNPASLEPIFGVYGNPAEGTQWQLYYAGGQFRLLADGLERPVYYSGENRFNFGPDYLDWIEIEDAPSNGSILVLHDGATGLTKTGARTGPVPDRKATMETLRRHVGRYEVYGTVVTIGLEPDGTLTSQREGDSRKAALRMVTANTFALDDAGVLLIFEGGDAVADTLRTRLGEQEYVGTRLPEPVTDSEASAAQEQEADHIVVTGTRLLEHEEFEDAVFEFVRELGTTGPINQIARWGVPVCPAVEGLSEGYADFVEERIHLIARRVGAPAGDCQGEANTLIIFTPEPDRLMEDVREEHAGLLGYHYIGQRRSLAAFSPPMKSWYITMTTIPGHYSAIDHAYGPRPPAGTGSRIRLPYKSRFAFVLVVVNLDSVEGEPIGPVADKIAMQVLSQPEAREGCSALPSISDFLEPSCPSRGAIAGLTPYDEAYLTGLYDFDRDELKGYMRETIAERISSELRPPAASETNHHVYYRPG